MKHVIMVVLSAVLMLPIAGFFGFLAMLFVLECLVSNYAHAKAQGAD